MSILAKKIHRLQEENTYLSDECKSAFDQADKNNDLRIEAAIYSCLAMWYRWRSLKSYIAYDLALYDCKALATVISPLVTKSWRTLKSFEVNLEKACGTSPLDLSIAIDELDKLCDYFDDLPSYEHVYHASQMTMEIISQLNEQGVSFIVIGNREDLIFEDDTFDGFYLDRLKIAQIETIINPK